jgi:hypothetical protein
MLCPYPLPEKFSDPFRDWEGSEAEMAAVLAKAPGELTREDYWMIFYAHLPAADYEEGCPYVLPYLDYLAGTKGLEERAYEGFFWYLHYFADRFRADGLLDPILDRLWECFLSLMSQFQLVRLTDAELKEHRICPSYREIAHKSRTLPDILDALVRWPIFDPLIARLQAHFDAPCSIDHSHWYCEFAHHARSWLFLTQVPVDRYQAVFDYFHRLERFRAHYMPRLLLEGKSAGFFEYNRRMSPI